MAKGNANPAPSPSPNTNPAPNPTPTPSPTGTGGGNLPTGNSGFSMNDSSMQGLQSKAGDLGSRLASISSGLRGLNFSGNALGPIGLFAVPALNASNDNAVSQADKGAKAFTDVQANLKATHQTFVQTDANQQKTFGSFDTSTNAKPPPGAANTTLGNNAQGGPKVSGPGSIAGGGSVNTKGNNAQGGPKVSGPGSIAGGGINTKGNNVQGGPHVTGPGSIKGGGGLTGGGAKPPGGPAVGSVPNIKGGSGPVSGGGVNTPGGPAVGAVPNIKGGTGPVTTGGAKGPGGPSVGAVPTIAGGAGPVSTGGTKTPGGPAVGATPNIKSGTAPLSGGGAKGPGGPGVVAPPVIGGATPGSPASSRPGSTPGGKGPGIPSVPGGTTPGSTTPGSKPGVTPPGPQNAVTSPSTSGPRGSTPPPTGAPGMAPPMAPGTPGAQTGGERGGNKFGGPGSSKGVFDAPKPGTPDSTISKPPPGSTTTPPPAPKPGTPGSPAAGTPGSPATPGSPKPGVPATPPPATPGTPPPATPGSQSAVTTQPQNSPPRGGITPGATPPAAAAAAATPPMAPGGANPGAGTSERGGSKFTPPPTNTGKGVFDAPKPGTPDNTISRAPGTSPSTPPPAPKPTPLSPPPASTVPPASTPSPNAPTPNTPTPNTPGPNTNTAPPTQSRPAPAAPPLNTPPTSAPTANVPPANTPSPRPDTTPSTQPPKADTAPAPTRPAPATPTPNVSPAPNPATNVPPPATPAPAPNANTPPPNVPPANTPSPRPDTAPNAQPPKADTPPVQTRPAPATPTPNVSPPSAPNANTPSPSPNTPPANTPAPNAAANVPPAAPPAPAPNVNTPSPNPATNVPPATTPSPAPNPNTPPVNAPATNVPPANPAPTPSSPPVNTPSPNPAPNVPPTTTPNPGDSGVKTRPAPAANVPSTSPSTNTTANTTAAPDVVVAPVPSPGPNAPSRSNQAQSDSDSDTDSVYEDASDQTVEQRIESYKADDPRQDSRWQVTPDGFKYLPNQPSEFVGIHVDADTTIGLTPYMAKQWLADSGIDVPANSGVNESIMPLLYDPEVGGGNRKPESYGINNAADFHNELMGLAREKHIQGQQHLVDAVNDVANHITNRYPPSDFAYVGLGRSPAAVVAALQNQGHDAVSIPLSNFRPPPSDPNSILAPSYAAHGGKVDPLTPQQQEMLNAHFDEFLGNLPPDRNVVLIDYTQGGLSLVSAQHQLQQYLSDHKGSDANVHAFAMHQDIDTANLGKTVDAAAKPGSFKEAVWETVWDTGRAADRQQWASRFEAFPITKDNPLGDAFRKEVFDDLAEYGSYKILDQNPATFEQDRPHREHNTPPGTTTGYEVLGDAVREGSPDTDTNTAVDNNASAQNNTGDNRPAPTRDTPPAHPAPNTNTSPNTNADTKTDAPKQVRSGGAPPAMTPPTPESHRGKDVLTDESWRHDPAKTADWSQPNNPADRSTWADRRNDTDVRTVDVVVHDVRTDSTPSNIKSYQGLINYDLRRIETTPGSFVQEYTVKVHVDPAADVDPDVVQQVKDNATAGVNNLLNQGFRLPSGDQFHLNLEFTDNKADAHTSIKVDPNNPNVDQTHWNPDTSQEVLAHETLHYLGIPDEYKDSSRVFQQHDTNSGVHQNDGGLMGADVHLPDPGIRPRHLWLIERTANSQVMVPDTTINPAGPATVPPPPGWTPPSSTNPAPDTTTNTDTAPSTSQDTETRGMPKRAAGWDSDSDSDTDAPPLDERPTKKKYDGPSYGEPGPSNAGPSTVDADQNTQADVDMHDAQTDSQVDALTDALNDLSLGNVQYNKAFGDLANDGFDLPTKDNYLAKLKESVEADKRPSFVVNMIVSHNDLGRINDVINSITADAGPTGKDMVFVVGVNGPNGSGASIASSITQANTAVSGRPEPIALVPLPTFDPKDGFPYGTMRNETMHSPATTFAIGALNGKGTHPYISFQDFDTGSRKVTGDQKDIFNHFKDSLNPPGAGPIRPLLYSGGYRVGDPNALVNDTRARIDSERNKVNSDTKLSPEKKAEKLEELRVAEQQLQNPAEFVQKFQQAMSDDMDARNRQKDSAPLLPYSPEPNLFMDANVTVVDPDVKFSKDGNEFGGLSQSINKFAGNEIAEIHQNQLQKPELNQDVKQAKEKLEADIRAQGGTPSPAQARVLASLDAEIKAKEIRAAADPEFTGKAEQMVVDSGIDVDLKTNRNPYRGENFTSDFVNGAVGTDLSRLALGFAKSEGKSWPQSHVALTSVTSRMYAGVPDATGKVDPQADRAAKADVSGAKIRDEFQDKKPKADGRANPKNKPHEQREAQQLVRHTETGKQGGWNPSDADAKKLGIQDKNTLSTAVSAPVEGHGHMGIDPTAKQEKMAAMLNLALSSNPSNVTRTFGTLEHGVLPIAADPRPDGMFNAVHEAMVSNAAANPAPSGSKKGRGRGNAAPEIKSAKDLRAGAIQKGSIASPAITKQIANFRQEHGLENGHLVTALIEPGPAPKTDIPAHFNPGSGDVAVDNSTEDPNWTPPTAAAAEADAKENAAEKKADNAKTAKAEELAAKLLATEIGRPITIHGPNGTQTTVEPFYEPAPEINSKSKPADIKKAGNWAPPTFPPPLELDGHPQPNGKTRFTPHDPANPPQRLDDPGEGPSGSGPMDVDPDTSRGNPGPSRDDGDPGPSTRGAPPAPDTDTRPAPPAPDVETRPAPPRPTPNPVIPMTVQAPPAVGQVMPGTQDLPEFFQSNKALGTIAPTDVRGAENVTSAIPNLKPADAARIQQALNGDFESFLDNGRNFQVKIGNTWYEANVRATMQAQTATAPVEAPGVKVDMGAQSGNSSSTTHTVATANDIGGSATAGVAMGPYGSLGGKAQLATPAQAQSTSSSLTDQRIIRAGEGSTQATVQVSYDITLTDANGRVTTIDPVTTGTEVTLQIPNDLAKIVNSGAASAAVTPPDAKWGAKIEHPAPEAVSVGNQQKAFADVAAKLHPSITKVGSPGREALQNFLSPTEIRNNLGAMLGGAYVTSPDLISPHASKGAAVQMTAKLHTAELVGTLDTGQLRLHEVASHSSGVSSTTKSGGDVTAGFGGNIGVPNAVGGQVGATLGYSARVAENVNAGTNTSHRTGIQLKGDTGLYKVTAEVEVRTPSGADVKIPVTTYLRLGLPEAGALGLPTPDGTRNNIVDESNKGKKFPPPYLGDALAAGNAKVGEFEVASEVQSQVEGALRDLPGFGKFLPNWNNPDANPRSSKGQSFGDVAEQLANQRRLTSQLSPAALKANMDSLMGPGVQVQLKNSGKTSNTYVNITVKAKVSDPVHLGQADARNVRESSSTGPKLDSSTATTKGWSGGVEGKVTIPAKTSVASLTPTPQFGVKYNHSWTDKTSAGPTVNSTSLNVGSPNAQVFRGDVEFEVEITTFTRPRAWVRRIVPGAPGFHSPEQSTVAKTGDGGLKPIKGGVNLWVSDSSTLDTNPGNGFKPGDPEPKVLRNAPTVQQLLTTGPKEKSPDFLHVEAVANTTALRDQAVDALNRAAGGDSALTVPGTASRAQIDKMFSPENIKANLRKLTETGMQEQGLKYDRRVTDRTGAIGVSFQLANPRLVSISDNTGTENAHTGGYKASQSSSTSRSADITGGVNVPVKPNVTAPPAGEPTPASGSGGAAVAGKVTPWSDSKSSSTEVGGSHDRNFVTPGGARTVLVQLDADVTVVGESRAGNFLHGGTPKAEGATVTLPKSVFVRVTEDVARDMGLLPDVQPSVPRPDFPKMAPPSTVAKDQPGALGLSVVESAPDLSGVVAQLTQDVNAKTAKRFGDPLLPDSVLRDSMSNLQRLVDFSSPASVKAMIDSALDGGVPLLVHQPGTFGKDSYQVTLRARADTPKFQEVVNDGVEMESTISGSHKVSDGQGRGTGWGLGLKAPGLAAPGSANPNVSGTAGVIAAANIGQSKSSSVTTSTTDQFGHFRAASGPAARYTVPIEFELVVEKGDKVVATAPSGPQEMTVRLHADNQKVAGQANPKPYWTEIHTRTADQGSPQAASQWQMNGNPATLMPGASVENLRGAKDLREATIRALKDAGAGKGLTGKGTGSLNSLLATLSPENLQPHLPSMLSGPLTVPGLHEAALTFGQDADVKVYAKLVDPSLGALSDNVAMENPKSQATSTSGEAKVTESGDVSVGLATGGAGIKQNTDPKDNVSVGVSGVELRHAAEDSTANSGGPTDNKTNNLKPKATTGLVQFGVEYRVVATIGGKTSVVDLSVPNSAAVRMPAADAQTVLGHEFGQDLKDAQAEVKKAADDWRTAEVAVDTARHDAQRVINEAAAKLARNDSEFTQVQIDYNAAIERHLDEQAKLPPLEARAETASREAVRTLDTVAELKPRVDGLGAVALSTQYEVDGAKADRDAEAESLRSLEDQLARTPDAAGLREQVDAARLAHADAEAAVRTAEAEAGAARTALHEAQRQLADAEAELVVQRGEAETRSADLAAQQEIVAQADAARTAAETRHEQEVARLDADRAAHEARIEEAETKLDDARRAADDKQKQWWDKKAVVDQKIAEYNNPRVEAESTRSAPPPPDAPSASGNDTAATETRAPRNVPDVVIDSHLKALTADAMQNASPLARDVEAALRTNPGTYLDHEAGLDLLRASVVLDTRADDIATMIQRHGVEAVARSFNREFGRPIIESAQLQQFGDLGTPESRTAFDGWAHRMSETISKAVSHNRTGLGAATGAEPKTTLQDNGMVDEDVVVPSAAPASTLPPANGQTTNTWSPQRTMQTQLGAPATNPAVPAPMPAPSTQQQLRYLNEDVLVRQPTPPTSPNGLYAAIGQARNVDPATLRQQVVSLAATHQAVSRAVADFTVNRPMHQGHLYGALVENINWHMQADPAENTGAGNARDLLGHLIATRLSVNVRIHQPNGNVVLLRPMGPPFEETVDVEMVMDGRQVTYRLRQGVQPGVQMH
ncbi:hypothetical protein GCM10022267_61780 [Lentzea roselyniae]|uniref:Uncharacterized protein n=1 Tax=Lentzea roselyniae TaxID=531940 RepID=A0ABP7BT11_9PSEU